MKFVLTIAGSDPTGGAGIQADLKTITALGCYALSAVTAVTSQTSKGLKNYISMDPLALKSQLENLYKEFSISAVKIGMLARTENLRVITGILSKKNQKKIVVDPIIFSGNRVKMIDIDGIRAYRNNLFPISTVVTPNIDEAGILTEMKIQTVEHMMDAAKKIAETGAEAVVVKGGHLAGDPVDVLYFRKRIFLLPQKRIKKTVHGAGCAFSSAIATYLARNLQIEEAVRKAQVFTFSCIQKGFKTEKKGKFLLKHI